MAIREGTFYGVWPVIDGKPLNLQWGEIRSNQAELKAISRNSLQELEDGVDELNALRSYLGQAYGDLDFRNKFRIRYEPTTKELCCQKNDGTVDTPVWTDAWCVRFHDGQFQVVAQGGIQSEAGFYGPGLQSLEEVAESSSAADVSIRNPTKIFFNAADGLEVQPIASGANKGQPEIRFTQPFGKAQQFTRSGRVWQINHDFGVTPVLVQVMDDQDRVVIPDKADVSDPNTAWFYFNDAFSGSVYVASGGVGASSLVPRDPFYLVIRTEDQPASPLNTFQPNVDMIFDSNFFYINPDQDTDAGGAHKKAFVSLNNPGLFVHQQTTAAFEWVIFHGANRSPVAPHAFDTLDREITPDVVDVSDPNTTYFYFNTAQAGKAVIVSEKPRSSSSSPALGHTHTQDTAAIEWVVSHQLNQSPVIAQAFNGEDKLLVPDTLDVSNPNIAYFYFTEEQRGSAFVVSSNVQGNKHSAMLALDADDHTQYALVDGSREFSDSIRVAKSVRGEAFYFNGGGSIFGVDDRVEIPGEAVVGNPGNEGDSINVGGTEFLSPLKISKIGGAEQVSLHLHRHSTSIPPRIVASRSDSADESHGNVDDGDTLFELVGTGWQSSTYEVAAEIDIEVDGTPSAGIVPGRIVFKTNKGEDTGVNPDTAMTIHSGGHVRMEDTLNVENAVTAEAFYTHSGGEVGAGVNTVTDGTNTYQNINQLNFNAENFYLSSDAAGEPVVNLISPLIGVVIRYVGNGVSGRTVQLSGINRAHMIWMVNVDAAEDNTNYAIALPGGDTGSIIHRRTDAFSATAWELDAPAQGTDQLLTINSTVLGQNQNGKDYRLWVQGTPTFVQ